VDPTGLLTDANREALRNDLSKYRGGHDFAAYKAERTSHYEGIERDRIDGMMAIVRNPSIPADVRDDIQNSAIGLMGDYNRDIVPKVIKEYGGKNITGNFEDDYKAYKQDPHPGVDFVNSEGFKSPFYTQLTFAAPKEGTSNQMVFSVIGTNLNMRLKHSDTEDVRAVMKRSSASTFGGAFSPGETIVPFPERGNPSSMKPHFHLEMNNIVDGVNKMINPLGLGVGTVEKYLFNYGTQENPNWGGMNEKFGR
ncbi:MAG: hypothetical protein JXN62_11990, partial [Bacteroidales bacterium]|nr:hypothetical protein [Bacteroidales bacterium]